MFIKALAGFVCFDGVQMNTFNVGDEGELADNLAQPYIDAGMAEEVDAPKGKKAKAAAPAAADEAPAA